MKRLLLLLPLMLIASSADAFGGKQEPWATPKGDARVDCAVYQTKYERWSSAGDAVEINFDRELAIYQSIKASEGEKAADDYFMSYDNPYQLAVREKAKLSDELDLAKINVAKHLGYSKQRLKEMWEWRLGDGPLWKANLEKREIDYLEERAKGLPRGEIRSFCEKL